MKLLIEISDFTNGIEMENNLNKAITDFGEALKKRGFADMRLKAYNDSIDKDAAYAVVLDTKEGTETEYDRGWKVGYDAGLDDGMNK